MRDGGWHRRRCPRCGKPLSVDFARVKGCARPVLPQLVCRLLPRGRRQACEWVALNPTRLDRRLGSFRVNLRNGMWCDFATGDAGSDITALTAYLFRLSQVEAGKRLSIMLGIEVCDGH